ncbi:MAG: hypothetical protein M3132_08525 [Actinomycetia bacterium]|nr:hypothetical protein [Actinomycetes bacterium]
MQSEISLVKVRRGPVRRHDSRVRQFSRDYALLERLDGLAIDAPAATGLIEEICWSVAVESPRLKFHARRSPYTGATEHPRAYWVAELGEAEVQAQEHLRGKALAPFGAIRLGRRCTLMTIAHELGHHIVFALDPHNTPAHGKIWIGRFDNAAQAINTRLT